tara:strand:- start:284 stop:1789 length:1506 start_codon:yes stop_codon:yes gene_type:complete
MNHATSKNQSVLFLIDTQGTNVVGCYRPDLKLGTPHLDRLASEGIRFDKAYTCSPVCGPARSAIFTGLYPHSNGVLGNDMAPHADLPTLGQRLTKRGIKTGYVGKWHLDGFDYFGDGRCPNGWDPDIWFDGLNYLQSLPDETARQLSRNVHGPESVAEHGITSEFTHAHRIADRAIQFIETHRDEDFLLVVSIDEPHHPFICPEPFISEFEDFEYPVKTWNADLSEKTQQQRDWAEHQEKLSKGPTLKHSPYFACNSYCDSQIGRVLSSIDRTTPDALVIHTSDHGDMLNSHGLMGKGPVAYEEVTRIPLIVRWPRNAPAGASSKCPVSHIDLVPTLLDYHGLEQPPILQGKSLLPQLEQPAHRTNDCVFIEFNRFEVDHDGFGSFYPIRAATDGRYKLALNLHDRDEFYDLESDPDELNNRIDLPSPERDRLHRAILDWMDATRDPFRGPPWHHRPWSNRPRPSYWGGPTRPRPFDPDFSPPTRLYETGKVIDRAVYRKD